MSAWSEELTGIALLKGASSLGVYGDNNREKRWQGSKEG